MAIKRAKTLDEQQFAHLLRHIEENSTFPKRDKLIVMLSFKAGLRVGEIAKIDLAAMTDAQGEIGNDVVVGSHVGKGRRERSIPMHKELRKALREFREAHPTANFVAISSQPFQWMVKRGERLPRDPDYKRMSPVSLARYYWNLLHAAGFEGVSTHSGRRTFGTNAARQANKFHQSIKDVQRLLGHSRLETTERYIEETGDTRALVNAL